MLCGGFNNIFAKEIVAVNVGSLNKFEDGRSSRVGFFSSCAIAFVASRAGNGKQATVGYCPEVWAAWE